MKNVMVRAWEIAKGAVNKFGGSTREYFAQALSMAWKESRKPQTVEFRTTTGSNKHKSWVAAITGVGGKYKFVREFINNFKNTGTDHVYNLVDGFYHVSTAAQKFYIQVSNGDWDYVEEYEIAI